MLGVWLYLVGLAVAGFLICWFMPDGKKNKGTGASSNAHIGSNMSQSAS